MQRPCFEQTSICVYPMMDNNIFKYLPKRNEYTSSHRDLHKNVQNCVVYNSPKWKKHKCPSIEEWIHKL